MKAGAEERCLVFQQFLWVGLVPVRLGRIAKETAILLVEGPASPHLFQGQHHVVQITGFARRLEQVQEEIVGFGVQKLELGAVSTVDRVCQAFHHAAYLRHQWRSQG